MRFPVSQVAASNHGSNEKSYQDIEDVSWNSNDKGLELSSLLGIESDGVNRHAIIIVSYFTENVVRAIFREVIWVVLRIEGLSSCIQH